MQGEQALTLYHLALFHRDDWFGKIPARGLLRDNVVTALGWFECNYLCKWDTYVYVPSVSYDLCGSQSREGKDASKRDYSIWSDRQDADSGIYNYL